MTQNEIIEMARQAGIDIEMWEKLSIDDDVFGYGVDGTHENLEAFAHLVAAKKQERIIEVVERLGTWAHITEVVAEIRGEA